MIFLKNIKFNKDIVFDSERKDHKKNFEVKTERRTVMNHRKGRRERLVERTFVIFKSGFSVDFNDSITVIVGDNGCGKTSFAKAMYLPKYEPSFSFDKTDEEMVHDFFKDYVSNEKRTLKFIESPQHFINGRDIHKNVFVDNVKNSKQTLGPMDVLSMWHMQASSNGENTLNFLSALSKIKNAVIILDEPETSLSIKSQINVGKMLKALSKNNQVIAITHSPVIMGVAKEVYDFERKEYRDTKEYVDSLYE